MKKQDEASILRQQFKKDNKLNYAMALVGKLLGTVMTIREPLI